MKNCIIFKLAKKITDKCKVIMTVISSIIYKSKLAVFYIIKAKKNEMMQ